MNLLKLSMSYFKCVVVIRKNAEMKEMDREGREKERERERLSSYMYGRKSTVRRGA